MLEKSIVEDCARRLEEAELSRQPLPQFSLQHPDITIEDAYSIQKAWMALKVGKGRKVVGQKIGLTSKAMQVASQISEPDYGILLDDMVFANGAQIPFERFLEPRIEVELAFILEKPLRGPECTLFDVLAATAYVLPAVEIIDARIERFAPGSKAPRRVMDTISDNAAAAGILLGGRPIKPLDRDLRWVSAVLYRNGAIEESGVAAAVLSHPAAGVAWLANKIAAYGTGLEAGQIILAGSFTRPLLVEKGDTFHIEYSDLGSIACRFT
jgi:2-oxo-hept-3-ene-1,7-dioate hydratase